MAQFCATGVFVATQHYHYSGKIMRIVITGTRREMTSAIVYVSKTGNTTYNASRAYVATSERDALAELAYRRSICPAYDWKAEKLSSGNVAKAVLSAVPLAESSAAK